MSLPSPTDKPYASSDDNRCSYIAYAQPACMEQAFEALAIIRYVRAGTMQSDHLHNNERYGHSSTYNPGEMTHCIHDA